MANIIIILIVIVLLGFALKGTFKHMKGESPCCGGGGGSIVLDIPDKKLDNPVLGKKVLKISGMNLTRNSLKESSKMPDTES